MELTIKANNLAEASDLAFRDYGVNNWDIIDFDDSEPGVIKLNVNKTLDSEIELINKVKSLVSSNRFQSEDVAFVCSDNKLHTPDGSTLFERLKSLLQSDLTPILGFSNFIDASDKWDAISQSLNEGLVAYDNLILTKEGSLLKGSKFKSVRKANSRIGDPIFTITVDIINPKKLYELFKVAASKMNMGDYLAVSISKDKLILDITIDVPVSLIDLLFICSSNLSGIKRFTISNGSYTLRADMK